MPETGLSILLVEDNPADAFLLQETLTEVNEPLEITWAQSVRQASEHITHHRPDVILLDLGLPDSDGLSTLSAFDGVTNHLPLIVLTGLDDESLGTEAVRRGAQDYLVKGQTKPRRLLQTIHHAIERKRAELNLRESQATLQSFFDSSSFLMGVLELDGDRLLCVHGNAALARFLGTTPHEVIEATGYELELPASEHALWLVNCERSQAEDVPARFEHEHVTRSGTCWLAATIAFIGKCGRGRSRFSFVAEDVTDRKRAEDERERLLHAAQAASAAKDQFIATLSHELRTPLTPVLALTSYLKADEHLPDLLREDMETIERNVRIEVRLIDDLLDLTRIVRGKVELRKVPFDLSEVLRDAAQVCARQIEARNQQFVLDVPGAPYRVLLDPPRIQQVFWNLIQNAVKFTPERGSISVRARSTDRSVIVEVSDTGAGIEPRTLPMLFDPFEQGEAETARRFGGLGLGLAISKALVTMHGGTITAFSEGKGHGATFTVELPLLRGPKAMTPSPEPQPTRVAGPVLPQRSRALRTLIVEDHRDTARMLRLLLSQDGHQVQIAGTLQEAESLIREAGVFDLLLCDLGLPDGSGIDLLRRLRENGNPLRAVALSGYGSNADVERSKAAGFIEHVVKPFDYPELLELIRRVTREADT